jgi:TolB protein
MKPQSRAFIVLAVFLAVSFGPQWLVGAGGRGFDELAFPSATCLVCNSWQVKGALTPAATIKYTITDGSGLIVAEGSRPNFREGLIAGRFRIRPTKNPLHFEVYANGMKLDDLAADIPCLQPSIRAEASAIATPVTTGALTATPMGSHLGKIAFSFGDIFVMAADGSDLQQLTHSTSAGYESPTWSPDGQKIAYLLRSSTDDTLYVMDADGQNQHCLMDSKIRITSFNWSPDSTRLAYSSNRSDTGKGRIVISTINVDGSQLRKLTNSDDTDPSWSPDGKQIAFWSWRNNEGDIYIMNANGSALHRLTSLGGVYSGPSWSPDGKQIAFAASKDKNIDIYVMDADGSNVRRLTNELRDDDRPTWSPDGKQIAFASGQLQGESCQAELHVMNSDGSNQRRVAERYLVCGLGFGDFRFGWSPNGQRLTFAAFDPAPSDEFGLYVIDADGSNMRRLITKGLLPKDPAWQP